MDPQKAAAAGDEFHQAPPQYASVKRLPTVLSRNTASNCLRLSRRKISGSRLTTVSKAPFFLPMSVNAKLAYGIERWPSP